MKRATVLSVLLAAFLVGALASPGQCGLGVGIHYLRTLGDINDNEEWNPDAIGFIGSYQFGLGPVTVEGDLEWIPDYGGTGNSLLEPSAWGLLGGLIYGGAGVGIGYIDGDWVDDPFYALRLGVNVGLFGLGLDVFGTYRFQNANDLGDFEADDLNSATFGAILRF
jgi:hypothetical protein